MRIIFFSLAVIMFNSSNVFAEPSKLLEKRSYRLEKTVEIEPVSNACSLVGDSAEKHAGKKSKFEVVKKFDDCDVVRFWSVYKTQELDEPDLVNEYSEYVLPKTIKGIPIESSVTRNGKKSGLLVVPFKYREDDGSITGEATVGYYAGWETKAGTLLMSAGLSQVSIPVSGTDSENQSALTIAFGYLLSNWDNVDIGFVVGVDHIGGTKGDGWQYEDDPWYSLMIGWNFSQ